MSISLTEKDCAGLLENLWGKKGELTPLGSCQDINYKVKCNGDTFVLKINSHLTSKNEVNLQNDVMQFLGSCEECRGMNFPFSVSTLNGESLAEVSIENKKCCVRLLKFVKGQMMSDFQYFSDDVLEYFGSFIGSISAALNRYSLTLPDNLRNAADREFQWDLRFAFKTIPDLLSKLPELSDLSIQTIGKQLSILDLTNRFIVCEHHLSNLKIHLRQHLLHGDLANYNVVAQRGKNGRPLPDGVIDFGDTMVTWIVGEIAVAILSGFASAQDPAQPTFDILLHACHVLKGFHKVYALNEFEVKALWPLIVERNILNIASQEFELTLDPNNEYNKKGVSLEYYMYKRCLEVPVEFAQVALLNSVGFEQTPLDLSKLSSILEQKPYICYMNDTYSSLDFDFSTWSLPTQTIKEYATRLSSENCLLGSAYGIAKLSKSLRNELVAPSALSLTTSVFFQTPTRLTAPGDGKVVLCDDYLMFRLDDAPIDVYLYGPIIVDPDISRALHKNEVIGSITCPQGDLVRVEVQVVRRIELISNDAEKFAHYLRPPLFCTLEMFRFWSAICINPTELFFNLYRCDNSKCCINGSCCDSSFLENVDAARGQALRVREANVASVQQHYFKRSIAPEIERGRAQYLIDTSCRAYLDMVNNVALVGHCHPTVKEACCKQLGLLNTNSRFLYKAMGIYCQKILDTIPQAAKHKLNCVLLVNSGSEATDLAMRIARTVVSDRRRLSGREVPVKVPVKGGVVSFAGAYHGITTASDEVSTTLNDNPRSLETRPPWIHLVPMYRGRVPHINDISDESSMIHEELSTKYAFYVQNKIEEIEKERVVPLPCCFIAESLSGNAGGIELPKGYLQKVYEKMRGIGALCIADEVQVGYGRLGTHFWGFEEHGVIPDLVTMAKASGNGHPLGFVITSKEIADEFGCDGSFFSSAGGNPVSCAVGSAVIDIIHKEKLQENAANVGAYIHEKLLELSRKYPTVIGNIHGHGLYQGVEIIRVVDGKPEPGTEESYAICERLLSLGVICHNTGDYSNMLKVKPPLCFTKENADHFVNALECCVKYGW